MNEDPLDAVFETPEQSLAHYLKAMPKSLWDVFQREFVRRPKEIPFTDPTPATSEDDTAAYHGQERAV